MRYPGPRVIILGGIAISVVYVSAAIMLVASVVLIIGPDQIAHFGLLLLIAQCLLRLLQVQWFRLRFMFLFPNQVHPILGRVGPAKARNIDI